MSAETDPDADNELLQMLLRQPASGIPARAGSQSLLGQARTPLSAPRRTQTLSQVNTPHFSYHTGVFWPLHARQCCRSVYILPMITSGSRSVKEPSRAGSQSMLGQAGTPLLAPRHSQTLERQLSKACDQCTVRFSLTCNKVFLLVV